VRRALGTVTVWAMAALGCDGATPFPPEWQDASVASDTATADDAGREDAPAPRDTPTTEDAGHTGDVGGGGGADVPPLVRDAGGDVVLGEDAACTSTSVMATLERLPVDIVWMVDNSVSMAPAIDEVIRGLNAFSALVGSRGLDYRVVMLSLRNRTRDVTLPAGRRYAVCIPRPLAGDDNCGNGPNFLHASVDIRSTQPLEQMLGTLGQTMGYTPGTDRGGEPWRHFLRPAASKTFVVVTDDNSRFSATQFDSFQGGANPFTRALTLPPGVLHNSWAGLFRGYTFSGIYGWGSETNPDTRCVFPDGSMAPAAGTVYTDLVQRTGGVRARLCDGAAAWGPFFEGVATAVERSSRIQCDLALPAPPTGTVLDPRRVNVSLRGAQGPVRLGKVSGPTACGPVGGWYYDNDAAPTRVLLCPASCTRAQTLVSGGAASVSVEFGCITIPG
jgi:hypothetical protein